MHGFDWGGGSQQWRAGVSQAGGSGGSGYVDGDYCDSDRAAGRDCAAASLLRDHGYRPRSSGISECVVDVDGSGGGQRDFLPRHDVFGTAGALPFGQYFFCGFSAAVPDGGSGRLSSPFNGRARAATGVFGRNLGAGDSSWTIADFVSRRNRPLDSSVRSGSIFGFHVVAGWDGWALVADSVGSCGGSRNPDQWLGRVSDWNYGDRDCGGEVCRGSLGGSAVVTGAVALHEPCAGALQPGGKRARDKEGDGDEYSGPEASHCDSAGGSMECGYREGTALC